MYTKIWGKNSSLTGREFDSELVYGDNDKYIKTKIKSYGAKVNISFQVIKIPKENSSCKCLFLVMLDSVIKASKTYYPQTLLEEWKHEIKKNKMGNLINLDPSLSDESDNESDNESNYESKNSFKKSESD